MSRHLRACPEREQALETADAKASKEENIYHIQVEDAWGGDFWLHLEVRGSARLKDLDSYLRTIWLECCGHLSMFSFGGWSGEELPMSTKVDRLFEPGMEELTHIYDFGTSSHTTIKVRDARRGSPLTGKPIYLMARNKAPEVVCMECEQPATYLCVECIYEEELTGLLCEEHVVAHPHDDYGEPLPIVNSPRVGMCGYEGPAEPPY